jgi:hypothetical protein
VRRPPNHSPVEDPGSVRSLAGFVPVLMGFLEI